MTKLAYPLIAVDGALVLATAYQDKVGHSILSAVQTYQEERVMRPSYGIATRPFDTLQLPDILRDLRTAIATGLVGYTQVTFEVLGRITDDGTVTVNVVWTSPQTTPQTVSATLTL